MVLDDSSLLDRKIGISSCLVHTVLTDLGDEEAICKMDPKNADTRAQIEKGLTFPGNF